MIRVLELLPGAAGEPIKFNLHDVDKIDHPAYEAISYDRDDGGDTISLISENNHKHFKVTQTLYDALHQFRLEDRSRMLWADALCIYQQDVTGHERNFGQAQSAFRGAETILIWLGPDNMANYQAQTAVQSINQISDFLCSKLDITIAALASVEDMYQEIVFSNKQELPLPNDCGFSNAEMWKALVWFYSQPYFSRISSIQDLNAGKVRVLQIGNHKVDWYRVEFVGGYLQMETAFSKSHGFSNANCWYVATMTTAHMRQAHDWIQMLYLASNFKATDGRDVIYGLLGLMKLENGSAKLLTPNYSESKTPMDVYRDSVEAALIHYNNTDVLLYCTGQSTQSWIPRWNESMLFRNPFRFGKAVPWKSAGDAACSWEIDRENNILSLAGLDAGTIKVSVPYNESYFGNAMLDDETAREDLSVIWQNILNKIGQPKPGSSLNTQTLTAIATSLSFGLNEKTDPASEDILRNNFVAYLGIFLPDDNFSSLVPEESRKEAVSFDGHAFGKPVWDFDYPESSIFVTSNGHVGCCISPTAANDQVFIPFGSTYPSVIRPLAGGGHLLRGYSFVYGLMTDQSSSLSRQEIQLH